MNRVKGLYIVILFLIASCSNEIDKITPPAERSMAAISELQSELIAPANGWVLNYQPTAESGLFYILLNFNEDGSVHIESDVPGDEDYFFDQTINYRIDTKLSLEMIFETYGVFHFLFEQNASTFGAEFEFIYLGKEGENLLFASKSDNSGDQTVITLIPASANAGDVFSRELSKNMLAYDTISSLFVGTTQQIALADQNISLFWSIGLDQRSINLRSAAVGLTNADIVSNNNSVLLDQTSGYGFFDGKLVLTDPFSFSLAGKSYSFSEISLTNFSETGSPMCTGGSTMSPVYTGSATGLGAATMYKTLFDTKGLDFKPMEDSPYSVNVFFVADANGFSLSENGSINDYFPTATGFAFNYGFLDSDSAYFSCSVDSLVQPEYATGLYYEDDNGNPKIALRKFDVVSASENKVNIQFTSSVDPADDYYPCDLTTEERDNLGSITDEIFGVGGGEVHALYFPVATQPDLTVFALYNACNNYEFLLVQ
ncbi:DUF4302 domain-containing protein [Reichenbachiella sp.]|uniref:DUF4302 domain-containing protein n=1 Tax=Reichenbachiella sp. TaxID=2184521 RepID=UPI003B5CED4C